MYGQNLQNFISERVIKRIGVWKIHITEHAIKAMLLVLAQVIIIFLILFYANRIFFKLNTCIVIFVFVIPLCTFIFYIWKNRKASGFIHLLTSCRFKRWFPFWFWYVPQPVRDKTIDMPYIKRHINKGDVLLRRYTHNLDGLIFKQNSYFTHAGICGDRIYYGDPNKPDTVEVWHATAEKGVHQDTVEGFCDCDTVAIVRFKDRKMDKNKKFKRAMKYFNKHQFYEDLLTVNEQIIFASLVNNDGHKKDKTSADLSFCMDAVLEKAQILKGRKYDFNPDFEDPQQLCCIEYVWYCYLCLFPLHLIKMKKYPYFGIIKVLSLIPDIFVTNSSFKCVYTSIQGKNDTKQLKRYIRSHKSPFWKLMVVVCLWQLFFLFIIFKLHR